MDVEPGKMATILGPSGCGQALTLLRCIAWPRGAFHRRRDLGWRPAALLRRARCDHPLQPSRVRDDVPGASCLAAYDGVRQCPYPCGCADGRVPSGRRRSRACSRRWESPTSRTSTPHASAAASSSASRSARSLVIDPKVILFDEPLSNVDAKVREDLRVELLEMQRRVGFAGVYVTHDQEEAMAISTP